jgi:hypothetical protein
MEGITLPAREWLAVARELAANYGTSAPAGLRERIQALVEHAQPGWGEESLTLELDRASVDVVIAIVRRGRGMAPDPDLARAQMEGVAEAMRHIRGEPSDEPDEPVGPEPR